MKKTAFNGYVYYFSVDYDAIAADDIPDIQKYLIKNKWRSVVKCLSLIKNVFFAGLVYLSPFTSVNSLSSILMKNQECKARPQMFNVNSDDPVFFPFSIKTSKFSGICNNVNDPYAKVCIPDVVKNLNVKAFNLLCQELMKRGT